MQELQITMLGASGVGKTTLLTVMYEQFESTIGSTNLQLTPDDDSSTRLQDRLGELKTLFKDLESKGRVGIEGTEALAGSSSLPSFTFGIGKKGEKPSLRVRFWDYPGRYLEFSASPEEKDFLHKCLCESAVVVIAIDAPSLMEEGGRYHETINKPHRIKDLLTVAYEDLNSPRMVIFAPVKCEKYLRKPQSLEKLSENIRHGYSNLINHLNSERLTPWLVSVVTPVQTVGEVIFSRIKVEGNIPYFYYRKTKADAKYSPRDSEQPLRYLLRFLLKLHLDERSLGFLDFIRDWLKLDDHLKKSVEEFARGCKRTDGFIVLKGEKWLNI